MIIMSPLQQMLFMIKWFFQNSATSLDIHLRCPKIKNASYFDNNWFWITRNENLNEKKSLDLLKWCRFKNMRGSDIYIRPHRHKDQPILFLDDLDIKSSTKVSQKYTSLVVQTSANNTQMWIVTDHALNQANRLRAQRYISNLGYSDKGSISGEHLGRLCGVKSQKRNCWVNLIIDSSKRKYPPKLELSPSFSRRGACAYNNSNHSESEVEFIEVLKKIRKGIPLYEIELWLTQKAEHRGKRQSQKYTQRTIEKANIFLS